MKKKATKEAIRCVCGHNNNYHTKGTGPCNKDGEYEDCRCKMFIKYVPPKEDQDGGWFIDTVKFVSVFTAILVSLFFFGYFGMAFVSWLKTDPLHIII